jgi:glutathione S-transferase
MKLIGSVASPYVRKVRIVMAEKKIDHELVVENVWSPDTTISLSNPLGKVPCLIMEDGGAMFDSRVIVEYLDTLTPVGKLIPTQGRERASVKCWEALAERTQRAAEQQSEQWVARQMGKVNAGLAAMSTGFTDTAYCAGNQFTLADVAVGCALGWL